MNRIHLRRLLLPALALGALLTVPSAWAEPRERMAGTPRAEGAWIMPWDSLAQLWSRTVRWISKNGPTIDPSGAFPTGAKNGPSIDPSGSVSGVQSSSPVASSPQGGS
jgi:hypothetical protein